MSWDDLLKTKTTSGSGSSNFGDLKDMGVYGMKVDSARILDSGSLLIKAKTTTGSTGIGSFVSGFYSLRAAGGDVTEKHADMDKDSLKILAAATGISEPATLEGALQHVADNIVGKEFIAQVSEKGEYNGNRQFNIRSFTVAPKKELSAEDTAEAPKHEINIDTTSTSSDSVKKDFGF